MQTWAKDKKREKISEVMVFECLFLLMNVAFLKIECTSIGIAIIISQNFNKFFGSVIGDKIPYIIAKEKISDD